MKPNLKALQEAVHKLERGELSNPKIKSAGEEEEVPPFKMQTLEEIFKDKPELLREPAVMQLLAQVREVHFSNLEIAHRYTDFFDTVLDLTMHSELVIKSGRDCKEVVRDILKLQDEF